MTLQIENLKKLRDFWLDAPDELLKMHSYAQYYWEAAAATPEHPCNSCMCAIGSGPSAGVKKLPGEDWLDYSVRVFGLGYNSQEYLFLFSHFWPDDRRQLIARLTLAIDNKIPKDWSYDYTVKY
jgi:hypothetical protein